MRKTITGTGGMLLLQTLKDAGVEYLFTNPGSAETGLFAAIAEDGDNRLVVGKHEGLVAAMADGYHRVSGKVGVVIAHVMGGSYQLAGQDYIATPAIQGPLWQSFIQNGKLVEWHFFSDANHGFRHPDNAGFQPYYAELTWPLTTSFLQRTV